jgi:diacylglycerol kinase family enzyme
LSYVVGLLQVLLTGVPSSRAKVRIDGQPMDQRISLAAICNGQWVGGVFHIAPRARVDDGRLQVVLAEPLSRRQVLRLAPRVMRGTHEGIPEARFLDCRRLTIELDDSLPMEADGEVRGRAVHRVEIELLPGALGILA